MQNLTLKQNLNQINNPTFKVVLLNQFNDFGQIFD